MSQEKISAKVLYAIFATGILSFCGVAGETAMNITFPILMKEFEINTATVQWVTTIYLLVVDQLDIIGQEETHGQRT